MDGTFKTVANDNGGFESESSTIGNSSPQGEVFRQATTDRHTSNETLSTKLASDDSGRELCKHESDMSVVTSNSGSSEKLYGVGHFTINWTNLDYVVGSEWYQLSTQRKPILDSLTGSFKSGELSAVLGPSGAGKSTLIDCLMGKRDRGLRGQTRVVFDNPIIEKERRRKKPLKIATIPQQDHLLDTLTVMETFIYASKIKNAHLRYDDELPSGSLEKNSKKKRKPFDHFANVQRVIQQLSLSSCASLQCGSLSGGQYKRVSIGQELLSHPDIMILDEPTSGLDSVTCFQTINALRQLIDTSPYPMAIVATIHQPDVEVFNLFHKAYVLATGGRAIYEGPTDRIYGTIDSGLSLVESRFSSLGSSQQLDRDTECKLTSLREKIDKRVINPARLIVEIAANEYGFQITSAMNELQRRQYVISQAGSSISTFDGAGSSSGTKLAINIADFQPPEKPRPPGFNYEAYNPLDPVNRTADLDLLLNLITANVSQRRSVWVHLKHMGYHTARSWKTIVRDPMLFSVQIALHILVPLLISYSFYGRKGTACPIVGDYDVVDEAYSATNILEELNRELRGAFENLGYMFFQVYVIIFAAVCMTSLTYPLAMHVLLKEYRNGWYSMMSYFMGRTLADLPVPTMNVFLAMAISYHLTGQPMSPYGLRFLSVASLTTLATLVAQTQGLMFGAMLMNAPQSAVFVAPASTAPLVVVSGFLLRIQSLPGPLQIISNFSYFTHLLNGFIISTYGFSRCPCEPEDFASDPTHKVPSQAGAVINIWLETFRQDYSQGNDTQVDLIDKLVTIVTKAKTFGFEMTTCDDVKPFPMLDYQLEDFDLIICFAALISMLVAFRWITYMVLAWKISSSI